MDRRHKSIGSIIWSIFLQTYNIRLRIGSRLACVYRVMDARGKFREHERSVRVAEGVAESKSSFLSVLETFQGHP